MGDRQGFVISRLNARRARRCQNSKPDSNKGDMQPQDTIPWHQNYPGNYQLLYYRSWPIYLRLPYSG